MSRVAAQFMIYGLVGVINTAVDWSVFWVLGLFLPATPLTVWSAKAASYAAGIGSSFALNSLLTFRDEFRALEIASLGGHLIVLSRFFLVAVLALLVNSSVYTWLAQGQFLQWIPLIAATGLSFVLGFVFNHQWTYRAKVDR